MLDHILYYGTTYALIPVLSCLGLYYTYQLRFYQIRGLKKAFTLLRVRSSKTHVSTLTALSTVVGSALGTGNISGVAVALTTGGPGSLFWMATISLLGAAIKYVECYSGVYFRTKKPRDQYRGGPMYYARDGVGSPSLSKISAYACFLGAIFIGNLVQVNSVSLPLSSSGIPPLYIGIAMLLLLAVVFHGPMARFKKVITSVVPVMTGIYLCASLCILIQNAVQIPHALSLIWTHAFHMESMLGGSLGYGILHTIQVGLTRGVFATDLCISVAPMVHAEVQSTPELEKPSSQGLVSMLSPIVVIITCLITGLVLITTGAFTSGQESTNMCILAFVRGLGSPHARYLVFITLFLFAYTTLLAWSFCCTRAAEFLWGNRYTKHTKILYLLLTPIGPFLPVSKLWVATDLSVFCLVCLNAYILLRLTPKISHHVYTKV